MIDLRYPIGRVEDQPSGGLKEFDPKVRDERILDVRMCPGMMERAVSNLDEVQLNTVYRPGGWTVRQVVHHVADSHMNALIRFKLGLTEDHPTIKPYNEAAWADLSDTHLPINISLTLLHAVHLRLDEVLKNIKDEEWPRTVFHPEYKKDMTLWDLLATYAWHGKHHATHITALRERMGWK